MIKTTIRSIMTGDFDTLEPGEHHIYVIRDGEDVLYVGRSIDVVGRVRDHITKWSSSPIGYLAMENRPQSFNWQVEFMTPDECKQSVPVRAHASFWEKASLDEKVGVAERAMIMHYHPWANKSNNPDPGALPAHIINPYLNIEVGATDHLF